MTQRGAHCHKLVASVAKEAAGNHYEILMGVNEFYSEWKRSNPDIVDSPKKLEARYIGGNWGKYIPFARATLAKMLTGPLPDHLKDEIVEALCLDATLMHGRPDNQQRRARLY